MSQFPSTQSSAGDFQYAERPAWPKVLGIISTVWGVIGLGCGACGVGVTLGMGAFMEWAAKAQAQAAQQNSAAPQLPTTPLPPELQPTAMSIVSVLLGLPIALLLLIAGIALLKRRPAARSMHMAYGILSVGSIILGLIGAVQGADAMKLYFAANPDDPWTTFFQSQGGAGSQLIQTFVFCAIFLIYPIFCVIWFGLVKRNPEDMGTPGEQPAA